MGSTTQHQPQADAAPMTRPAPVPAAAVPAGAMSAPATSASAVTAAAQVSAAAVSAAAMETDSGELWRVVAASEAGAGHLRSGTPCQDACSFRPLGEGWVAIAVADGAGSAAQAEVGAWLSVKVAVNTLARLLEAPGGGLVVDGTVEASRLGSLPLAALVNAQVALEGHAASSGVPSRQLACTLMVLLLGPGVVAAAGVGDGAAVVELAGGRLETLLRPDCGEYANETTFLTSAGAIESAQRAVLVEPVESLAVMTDGVRSLALHRADWAPFDRFFAPVFGFLRREGDAAAAGEEVRRMLRSDGVRSRTDDDVTLLVATRRAFPVRSPDGEPANRAAAAPDGG
jgi:hypothetical protein